MAKYIFKTTNEFFGSTFSRFNSLIHTEPSKGTNLGEIIEEITSTQHKQLCEQIRNAPSKEKQRDLKAKLPAIAFSGEFTRRNKDGLIKHSGYVCLDLDLADNPRINRDAIRRDAHTLACFNSPSGGLKVVVKVDHGDHSAAYKAAREYYEAKYWVIVDKSGSDVSRLCYLSHDPAAHINYDARAIQVTPKKPEPAWEIERGEFTVEKVDSMLAAIRRKVGRPDYDTWLKIISSTVDAIGEWNALSLLKSHFPEDTEGEYQEKMKHPLREVTAGTLVHLARDAGWCPERKGESYEELSKMISNLEKPSLFSELQARKFDPSNLTPEKKPLLLLNGIPVLYAGNLLTLVGQDKSGKSHVEAAIAKAITEPDSRHLGFSCDEVGRIAYIDCEQDRNDFESLLIRAGCDSEKVAGYHLTGLTANEAKAALLAIMEGEPDLSAVLIDGFADLLGDVNDSEQANQLVAELMAAAQSYDVAIVGVLHLNPGSDEKSRGHLGSQLGRKSQTVLQIKQRDDGSRVLFTQRARKRPIPEAQGVRFAWDDSASGFVEIEGTPGEIKQAQKVEEWTRTLYDIQAETEMLAWRNKELIEAIMQTEKVKSRTAQNRIKDWLDARLLQHDANRGVYTSMLGGAND